MADARWTLLAVQDRGDLLKGLLQNLCFATVPFGDDNFGTEIGNYSVQEEINDRIALKQEVFRSLSQHSDI